MILMEARNFIRIGDYVSAYLKSWEVLSSARFDEMNYITKGKQVPDSVKCTITEANRLISTSQRMDAEKKLNYESAGLSNN